MPPASSQALYFFPGAPIGKQPMVAGTALVVLSSLFGRLSKMNFGAVQIQDDLGLKNGFINLTTSNIQFQLVRDSQVLASLKGIGSSFDFLPRDYLSRRARNGQYHWGDITYRFRKTGSTSWVEGDSAQSRKPIDIASLDSLASANMSPTLPSGPLNITREWLDENGDLGLRFTLHNSGSDDIELGSVGFPTEVNSIFTGRDASDMLALCSLADPYIGMDAGYIRVSPTSGNGPALIITPLNKTPMEAYRNLEEPYFDDTAYGSQTFEGYYEWQVLSKAWAENEWANAQPWNTPSSIVLKAGQSVQYGLRFTVVKEGVREIDTAVYNTGTPIAVGVPGYIIPQGVPAQLFINASSNIREVSTDPTDALSVIKSSQQSYLITPSNGTWGRVRLTLSFDDGEVQTIHYYVTKPGTEAIADMGHFLTTAAWFNDTSDPFGRAPSIMTYDYDEKKVVTQDSRAWIAGLSDEGGVGAYLAAVMKQAVQPSAREVSMIEEFIDQVLWKTVQNGGNVTRKSIFFYEPSQVPSYQYSSDIDWNTWSAWNKAEAYAIDRAYDYVHVAAAYWSLYRVGRAYPQVVTKHNWDWYLDQAYMTIVRGMQPDVGYNQVGLMGETVFGEILKDLSREGLMEEAKTLTNTMRSRAVQWDHELVPFGSEMAWDSTGQEGVYYWTKNFGFTNTTLKTLNSVLGYVPAVPHWGWNGNARRYWDNIYGGKLQRIERQIHHYGSALNALVLLSAFRSNPSDIYLLRAGYGGISGPLSSIHQDGYVGASFHSWPDTLQWDGITGDYGPGFLGMTLGIGTYVVKDPTWGLLVFGGTMDIKGDLRTVRTTDPVRRRVFIGPLNLELEVDAGFIEAVIFTNGCGNIEIQVSQNPSQPQADKIVLWIVSGGEEWEVLEQGVVKERQGRLLSGSSICGHNGAFYICPVSQSKATIAK
ncbi:hypothetical protein GGI43DRAFT_432362 [Trichoderma evansii]